MKAGHNVHVASFDRGLQNLRDEFDVTEIHGFRFAYVNNRVRYNRIAVASLEDLVVRLRVRDVMVDAKQKPLAAVNRYSTIWRVERLEP